ncbi:hypothetical protein BU16DRAFT_564069 [Lophium mytilinum]|uniref:Uncharacterized protein n=1 Tax=Lophium mytilinum TaxID=390894 RepID=A0A6A6QKJ1_9PEZI|nr:hypothetical protein BU16DRAFT_564069 [Lophium mytilinum]
MPHSNSPDFEHAEGNLVGTESHPVLALRPAPNEPQPDDNLEKAQEGTSQSTQPDDPPAPAKGKTKRGPGRPVKYPNDGKAKVRERNNILAKQKKAALNASIENYSRVNAVLRAKCVEKQLLNVQLQATIYGMKGCLASAMAMHKEGRPEPALDRFSLLPDGGLGWEWEFNAEVTRWEWVRVHHWVQDNESFFIEQWESDQGFVRQFPQLFGGSTPSPSWQDEERKRWLPLSGSWVWGFNKKGLKWEWQKTHLDDGCFFVQSESDKGFKIRHPKLFKVAPYVPTAAEIDQGRDLLSHPPDGYEYPHSLYLLWNWNPHSGRFAWYFNGDREAREAYDAIRLWESEPGSQLQYLEYLGQ